MELVKNVCTNCGANVTEGGDGKTLVCPACGMAFSLKSGRDFAQKLDEMSKKGVEVDIMNLRRVLGNYIQKPALYDDARDAVRDILRVLPDDFRAQYYLCFLNRKRLAAEYRNFLFNKDVTGVSGLETGEVAQCAVKNGEAASEEAVRRFVGRLPLPQEDKRALYAKLDTALALELERVEWYAKIPRDVFVCHSSNDVAVATKVVKKLESEGFMCWVSTRNIPPDSPDYWQDIEDAIGSCRIFLVVSSKTARVKQDVLKEMDIAKRYVKPALEFNIDNSTNTIYFKNYFAGQWIPAYDGVDAHLPELAERVYGLSESIKHRQGAKKESAQEKQSADSQKSFSGQGSADKTDGRQEHAGFGGAGKAVGAAMGAAGKAVGVAATAVGRAVSEAARKAAQSVKTAAKGTNEAGSAASESYAAYTVRPEPKPQPREKPRPMSSSAKSAATVLCLFSCLFNIPLFAISITGGFYMAIVWGSPLLFFVITPFFVNAIIELAYAFSKRNPYVFRKKNVASIVAVLVFLVLGSAAIILIQYLTDSISANYFLNPYLIVLSVFYCAQVIIGVVSVCFQPKRIVL